MTQSPINPSSGVAFETQLLNVSDLVGREMKLYSEQLPGKELTCKVLAVQERTLNIGATGSTLLDSLVNRQHVIVQFPYKGEDVSIRAQLRRTEGGRCFLQLEEKVVPLTRRRWRRFNIIRPVRLAAFPRISTNNSSIAKLRWIGTDTVNFSSGGALVTVPSLLDKDICLIMNVELAGEVPFPSLVLAQVRHCYQPEAGPFSVGVEFITREIGKTMFSPLRLRDLPPVILEYSQRHRNELDKALSERYPDNVMNV